MFGSQKNYYGLYANDGSSNYALIRKGHLVPDEMWNTSGTNFENAFGGSMDINVASRKGQNVDNKAFGIRLRNVPEEACMALATYDWGSGSSSGLVAVGVNIGSPMGLSYYGDYSHGYTNSTNAVAVPNGSVVSVPMPVNIAATACQAGDDNTFTIDFY